MTPPGLSFNAYAKHRGCSLPTVCRAVRKGRLKESLVPDASGKMWIRDLEAADREWDAGANHGSVPAADLERVEAVEAAIKQVKAKNSRPATPPSDDVDDVEVSEQGAGMTLSEASTIEKRWRAKLVRLEYRKKAGKLVEAAEMEAEMADVFLTCRTKLLGIPTRARQRIPTLTHEDVAVLDELVRESLEELAK